jgi:hypothetical protein
VFIGLRLGSLALLLPGLKSPGLRGLSPNRSAEFRLPSNCCLWIRLPARPAATTSKWCARLTGQGSGNSPRSVEEAAAALGGNPFLFEKLITRITVLRIPQMTTTVKGALGHGQGSRQGSWPG